MTPEEGQFELGGLIGEGAFGKVFECFDKKDGKKFAMKKINLRKLSKDERDLAETEARLLTSLQHQYILHAVTTFQEKETLCIVTEFCDQGDLAQFLEERKGESLDEERIVEWFRQICSALEDEAWAEDLPDERHLYVYFWRRRSPFSQQYTCDFVVDGITYNSTEQYIMHQKAVLMGDQEKAEIIMTLDVDMKEIGDQIQNFDEERWGEACQGIVERGNMEKFSQNECLKEQLFSTYPKALVEANPLDNIRGIGLARDDRRAWNKLTWKGQNLHGEILTKVRDKLLKSFLEPVVPEKTEGDPIQQSE